MGPCQRRIEPQSLNYLWLQHHAIFTGLSVPPLRSLRHSLLQATGISSFPNIHSTLNAALLVALNLCGSQHPFKHTAYAAFILPVSYRELLLFFATSPTSCCRPYAFALLPCRFAFNMRTVSHSMILHFEEPSVSQHLPVPFTRFCRLTLQ